jgi:hypothetical protein
LKNLIEKATRKGWRRNTLIAVLASALALTGTTVASAYTLHANGQHHSSASSKQHSQNHSRWTKWTGGHHTGTTPAKPAPAPAPAPITEPTTPAPTPTTPAPTPTVKPTTPTTPTTPSTPGSWPDASNTGVPAGTALTPSNGLTVTKAGTVISGLDIKGDVLIRASNVTIKDSRITGRVDTGDQNAYPGAVIQRVEIIGPYDGAHDGGYPGVGYGGYTCDGCNVRGWGKGFMVNDDVTIKNSWVHDITVFGDPANGGSHNEAILSLGGKNLSITNNRLDSGTASNVSASLALYSQWAAYDNVLVQGNLFDGGGYCLYAGLGGSYGASNSKFIGNTFGNKYNTNCGWYGAAIAYDPGNGNQWSGNVYQKNGLTVPTPGRG